MTPKEKAKELIDRFYNHTFNVEKDTEDNFSSAKQCALIAVDEMLQIQSITMYPVIEDNVIYGHKDYWQQVKQEVKQEIDKL